MASSLFDATEIVQNGDFQRRTLAAVVAAAIAVQAEDPATVNHAARSSLASKVLQNRTGYQDVFSLAIALNSTVQADYPAPSYNLDGGKAAQIDGDLQFTVNGLWNAFS